ncbi:protein translocase subunit SecF [Pseudoduganella albidiflava]|uniref:Protein-export membrane protein SecF n=1 Tax=Pseudoduganella albidiflava TaxID=321983 RepID=A0A411X6R3_9BURK|nr:protein translocase subunit SecF [Pseudoduganella albidiflava]QBI04736.1 protein translocase subunit SecF [Pseudoduganella albidiflava]GGY44337.1 protein-export membrane protein SecF [Pseudoduganella albidiflava]
MEFFRIHRDIPFMRYATIFNVVSALTFVAAVFFLVTKGLHLSIEFKGGTVVEVKYPQAANLERMRESLRGAGFEHPEASTFGTASDVLIRLPITPGSSSDTTSARAFEALCRAEKGAVRQFDQVSPQGEHHARTSCVDAAGKELVSLQRVEFVGPMVGEELAQNGVNALIMVVVGVMLYLAVRFEWKYAVAAIIANLHDVVIIMGFFAFFQWEFSLTVLAAILAVLGYSVNESVVIFDRIRENFRKQRKMSVQEVIDNAITSTMSRTIITHGCTEMMVLSMLFFGGPTLHYFAVALTIGILFGIYSSVFVAAAVAMKLGVKREDLIKPVKEKDETDGAVV